MISLSLRIGDSSTKQDARHALTMILQRVRTLDEVGWLGPGVLGILLPETDGTGAQKLIDDLRRADSTNLIRSALASISTHSDSTALDDAYGRTEATQHPFTLATPASQNRQALADAPLAPASLASRAQTARPLREVFLRRGPWWKRPLDFSASLICLLLFAPLMLLAGLLIKLTSPGPVIYKSWRAGIGGQPFLFYKFRTMCVDAEGQKMSLLALNELEGPVFKIERDPRITPVGRILRKLSVDELPQLWNVLIGDMSLVGPRPPLLEEVEMYAPWQHRRLEIKGGLTCFWQVSGRSNLSFEEWCRYDIQYVETQSFFIDMCILLRTIPAVLSTRGAR